jgi:hypothetical protein
MNNLTYYLGAGASAGKVISESPFELDGIPILNVFNSKLISFYKTIIIKQLNSYDPSKLLSSLVKELFLENSIEITKIVNANTHNVSDKTSISKLYYFIEQGHKILTDLSGHSTVDTLARKYHLQGSNKANELVILKTLLSLYFLHLQHNEKRFDLRYDSFVSTILDRDRFGSLALPKNIKVISWNYDIQFEIALKKYEEKKLGNIQEQFGIHPSKSYHKTTKDIDSFGMVKLNGTAGLFLNKKKKVQDIDDIYANEIETEELLNMFYSICRNGDLLISPFYRYSWENDIETYDALPNMKNFLNDYAKKIMKKSNHIVVIGYSFPPFNRKIDLELFNCLPENATVYVQDTNPVRKKNIEDIFNNFEEKNIIVKFIEDVSQFYIPPSYFED